MMKLNLWNALVYALISVYPSFVSTQGASHPSLLLPINSASDTIWTDENYIPGYSYSPFPPDFQGHIC